MDRLALVLTALMLGTACADGAPSVALGEHWTRVEFNPSEFRGTLDVVDYRRGVLRLNNIVLSKVQVMDQLRKEAVLVPRPVVYLRFDSNDYAAAIALAREIRDAGGCDEVDCLFNVEGQ